MFTPNPFDSSLVQSLHDIPKILFRVADPESPGITTTAEVCSPALALLNREPCDLFKVNRQEASSLLNEHLRWTCVTSGSEQICNLMSWTSSLLFALQYALYRHRGTWRPQNLSKIQILAVDTSTLPAGTFARDLGVMEAFQGESTGYHSLDSLYSIRKTGQYYFGEYLSQGRVFLGPEKCCMVTMESLLQEGLFDVLPSLGEEENWFKCARRVNELRNQLLEETEHPIQTGSIQSAIRAAGIFGRLALPISVMLLGICLGNSRKSVTRIMETLKEYYHEEDIMRLQWINLTSDAERLPEISRLAEIVNSLQKEVEIDINDLIRNIGRLEL